MCACILLLMLASQYESALKFFRHTIHSHQLLHCVDYIVFVTLGSQWRNSTCMYDRIHYHYIIRCVFM